MQRNARAELLPQKNVKGQGHKDSRALVLIEKKKEACETVDKIVKPNSSGKYILTHKYTYLQLVYIIASGTLQLPTS